MKYPDIVRGEFLRRPNRFIAEVMVNGEPARAHVRNTGRCTHVLSLGCEVSLQKSSDPGRATKFTLIAVNTAQYGWVNLDSLAPNKLAGEWLAENGFTEIKPEFPFGDSRIDFYAEKNGERWLIEVKGCTLAENRTGLFPDAPTKRGAKHLRELAKAAETGYRTAIAFVIMLRGVEEVRANAAVDREFSEEFSRATANGVSVFCIPCECTADTVQLR